MMLIILMIPTRAIATQGKICVPMKESYSSWIAIKVTMMAMKKTSFTALIALSLQSM